MRSPGSPVPTGRPHPRCRPATSSSSARTGTCATRCTWRCSRSSLGQALLFGSWGALLYAGVVLLAVVLFVLGYEQPTLEREYGEEYREYRRHVRGWVPRRRP